MLAQAESTLADIVAQLERMLSWDLNPYQRAVVEAMIARGKRAVRVELASASALTDEITSPACPRARRSA